MENFMTIKMRSQTTTCCFFFQCASLSAFHSHILVILLEYAIGCFHKLNTPLLQNNQFGIIFLDSWLLLLVANKHVNEIVFTEHVNQVLQLCSSGWQQFCTTYELGYWNNYDFADGSMCYSWKKIIYVDWFGNCTGT